MSTVWFIHKWYRDEHRAAVPISGDRNKADRIAARLRRIYGHMGWEYRVESTRQRLLFLDPGFNI